MTAYDRVFASVFPPPSDTSIPTPKATPVLGTGGFEGSGEAQLDIDWDPQDSATEQVQWERAWHTATEFLSLPNEELPPVYGESNRSRLHGKWWKKFTPDVSTALRYLLSPDSRGFILRKNEKQYDLLHWYFGEVGLRHFIQYVRPQVLKNGTFRQGISNVISCLEQANIVYLHNLDAYILPLCPNEGKEEKQLFLSKLTELFTYSLPQQRVNDILREMLRDRATAMLQIETTLQGKEKQCMDRQSSMLLQRLQDIGFGDSRMRKIFAEVMSEVMSLHIKRVCAGRWHSDSNVTADLRYWVENRFARVICEVLSTLNTAPSRNPTFRVDKNKTMVVDNDIEITLKDCEKWQEIATNRLGVLRTQELYDIVSQWDNDSRGAIEDLKRYVTTTAARTHLTSAFSDTLSRRLLQPGAATTEILQMYIAIIRAFAVLDPKGVLLDRVVRPVRRYLRDRDDTIAILVASLLADAQNPSPGPDVLVEIAKEMESSSNLTANEDDDADLDFDDMEWMPDPIDAGPDYKKSKHLDVIGSLISLFETKDIFIKEFQQVLGERLLMEGKDHEKEIRVLELLKARFGEASLQACEVMLRDILDSRRVDSVIRNDQNLVMSDGEPSPELHARILSHLFWPSLHSENFAVPPDISAIQERYEKGFETLKQSRKLTWLNALGQATVHLELEDRTVTEVVQTWQASVIYAFQTDDNYPATKTVTELMTNISMSEALVRNGLTFWVGKLVLRPSTSTPDAYHVLETLPTSARHPQRAASNLLSAAAAADAATSAPAHAVRSEEEIMKEKMDVFWQFVVGMLTNQGAMPLTRIVMMLKVVVPGGFPFGNEELKAFLEGRVKEGKLEVVGGQYRIKAL
ncbi:MAG: hypothetical protein Q9184_000721 [Pyrenodesmia sp. 2 TL-2023]